MNISQISFSSLYTIRTDAVSWFPKKLEGRKTLPPAPKKFSAGRSFGKLLSVDLKPSGSVACLSMLTPAEDGESVEFRGHRIYIPLSDVVLIPTETERKLRSRMETETSTAETDAEEAEDILL